MILSQLIKVSKIISPEVNKMAEETVVLSKKQTDNFMSQRTIRFMIGTLPLQKGVGTFLTYGKHVGTGLGIVHRTMPHIVGNSTSVLKTLKNTTGRHVSEASLDSVYRNPFNGGCLITTSEKCMKVYNGIIYNDTKDSIDDTGYIHHKLDENNFVTLQPNTLYYLTSQAIIKYIPVIKKQFQCITRLNLPLHYGYMKKNDSHKISKEKKLIYT